MQKDTFATSDLTLAAFLACRGHNITAIDDAIPARVVFHLAPAPSAEVLADFASETRHNVNVQEFARAWRRVKRLCFGREGI